MKHTFRAIWPITDESVPYADLTRQAVADLPRLTAQAHARVVQPGRFSVARSVDVPGSGRITPSVLVYEAPAIHSARRQPVTTPTSERTWDSPDHRACPRCGVVREARRSSGVCQDCRPLVKGGAA